MHFKAKVQIFLSFRSFLLSDLFTTALNARYADLAGCGMCLARMISAWENEYRHSRPGLRPNFVHSDCPRKRYMYSFFTNSGYAPLHVFWHCFTFTTLDWLKNNVLGGKKQISYIISWSHCSGTYHGYKFDVIRFHWNSYWNDDSWPRLFSVEKWNSLYVRNDMVIPLTFDDFDKSVCWWLGHHVAS